MNSLLCCPVCGNPLTFAERSAYCKNGHTYDRAARGGYIHLLRQQRRGSSDPGDSAEMCQARTRFLEGGWYAPLQNQLAAQVKQLAPNDILDAGCGEGWYTHAISEALPHARIAGIDLSRYALRHAGRSCPQAALAIASLFDLPLADQSVELGAPSVCADVCTGICACAAKRRHTLNGYARGTASLGHETGSLSGSL